MVINSRNKGASFERQVAKMIFDHLGYTVKRNLDQYQAAGNYDLTGMPGWAIECKAYRSVKTADKKNFWTQACGQVSPGERPVVIYKADRQPIRVMFAPFDFYPEDDMRSVIECDFETWCAWVNNNLPTEGK